MTGIAHSAALRFGITPGDVYVDPLPLFHVGGQEVALEIAHCQATYVLVRAFDPALVLDLIASERAALTIAVPTMLGALLDEQKREPRDVFGRDGREGAGRVRAVCEHLEAGKRDRLAQVRDLVADRGERGAELVAPGLVDEHDARGLGLAEHVRELARAQERIHRYEHETRERGRPGAQERLGRRRQRHREPLARGEASGQAARE